jgi:Mg-chelatase subunit ChlD
MPKALVGVNATPHDEELIESVCYSRLAENAMVDIFNRGDWDELDVQLTSVTYGSNDGIFRRLPARHSVECSGYDPRSRPWYTAASSLPKDVVLVMDHSQSMNDTRLLIAKKVATTIIDTLTLSDRVAIITFSSDANVLLEEKVFIEATLENKEKLVKAIEMLEPANGTSNLYNAFNLTFDVLGTSSVSGETTPCTTAVVLLTDGHVDEGQSEDETSKVINFVVEQSEGLAASSGRNTIVFAYSVGEDADTSLVKRIVCKTGGLWKHIGDNVFEDLIDELSPYYKLFAMGLSDEEHDENIAWVEPYLIKLLGRWGISVSAAVFDRHVTPYHLVGVAMISIYVDTLESVHGENTTTALLQEWVQKTLIKDCPVIDRTECQLEALRFLGGGKNATCGVCNNTGYDASIVPETCSSNISLPIDLWYNIESEYRLDFLSRGVLLSFD